MHQYFNILGSEIPSYSVFAGIGLIAAFELTEYLMLQKLILRKYTKFIVLSLIGLIVTARGFGILSKGLDNLFCYGRFDIENSIKNSGIVYYGGLIGYITMLAVLCRLKKYEFKEVSNIIAVSIPLFHMFGRIGCFFAGCCYGMKSSAIISIPYRIGNGGEWTNRIPVQLLEAGFELLLFLLNAYLYKSKCRNNAEKDGKLLYLYLFLYSIWRFIIEFWRGDELRGVYGMLSFSQIISVIILIVLLMFYKKINVEVTKNE